MRRRLAVAAGVVAAAVLALPAARAGQAGNGSAAQAAPVAPASGATTGATGASASPAAGGQDQGAAAGSGSAPAAPAAGAGSDRASPAAGSGSAETPPATATTTPAAETPAAPATPPASGKDKKSKDAGKGKTATAPAKPPPPPPKPAVPNKILADVKWFDGEWNCTGHSYGPGPEHPTAATVAFAWQLDGFWVQSAYTEPKSATNPVPYSSISQWGWDPVAQAIASVLVDNQEGSIAEATPGWIAEKLSFEGSGHRFGVQFEARDTYTRRSASRFLHVFQVNVNGNWVKLREETCNRAAAK